MRVHPIQMKLLLWLRCQQSMQDWPTLLERMPQLRAHKSSRRTAKCVTDLRVTAMDPPGRRLILDQEIWQNCKPRQAMIFCFGVFARASQEPPWSRGKEF